MKNRRVLPVLLSGLLTLSLGTTAYASRTDEQIADIQAQRQEAEAELAAAQGNIYGLESKKQELENYLSELNSQYDELTGSVAELGIEAAQKEDELKQIKLDLVKARKTSRKQYDAMKIRIAYMYEKGGTSTLEMLLSAENFAEFLNRAENVSEISGYDREKLREYEELQKSIADQEKKIKEEAKSINTLLAERSAKQQEVQAMAASTSDSIASYIAQISESQEEANVLMAEIDSADNSIYALMEQAEAEKAAQEAVEAEESEEDYGYDPKEDNTESYSESTSSDVTVEEEYTEETEEDYEEESYEAESYESTEDYEENSDNSGAGEGTYLGNFTLTAYCNCAQCCGTAGNLTASGTVPTAGRTIAMAGVPFGTQLLINGNVYTVEDLGTPYGHVDIYFNSHSEALSFGLQSADVYQL